MASSWYSVCRMCIVVLQMVCDTRYTSLESLTFWHGMVSRSVQRRLPRQWNMAQRQKYPPYIRTYTLVGSLSLLRKSPSRWMNCSILVITIAVICQQSLMLGILDASRYCIIPLLVCRWYYSSFYYFINCFVPADNVELDMSLLDDLECFMSVRC